MRWLDDPVNATERALREGLELARQRAGDEIAQRRLWTRLAQPELFDPPRRRWPLVAGGALAAAAAAVVFAWPVLRGPVSFDSEAAGPPVASVPAQPERAPAPEPAADEPILQAPATVSTRAGEQRRGVLRGGARVIVNEASVLAIDPGGRPTVQRGEVVLEVPPQPKGRYFSVEAGPYVIRVIGTKFRVWHADGGVGVLVEEGVVEVWRGLERIELRAGQSWRSPQNEDVARPRASSARKAAGPKARGLATAGAARAPVRARLAARAPVAERAATVAPPIAAAAPPPASSWGPIGASPLGPAAPVPPTSSPVPAVVAAPPPPKAAAPEAPAPLLRTPAERFKEAQAALLAGEPDRAARIFGSLAQGQGPTAENAAYEHGRVLRDQLLRPKEAVKAWSRYRARFPGGLLAAEAHLSIVETLVSLGDDEGALAEAQEFLRRFPHSERRAEVARLESKLRRSKVAVRRPSEGPAPGAP
jgi:ferric-dicitrate binding protein FerR (iron transport regulator)